MLRASLPTKCRFWLEHAFAVLSGTPAWGLFVVSNALRAKAFWHSICITDVSGEADLERFTATVIDALELARKCDARRFARIEEHIRFIIRMRKPFAARYFRVGRACLVNDKRYPEAAGPALVMRLACTLVHESTHAYIPQRRIPLSGCRHRHERTCVKEVQRFLERVKAHQGCDPTSP